MYNIETIIKDFYNNYRENKICNSKKSSERYYDKKYHINENYIMNKIEINY